jgi:hypothetical protein
MNPLTMSQTARTISCTAMGRGQDHVARHRTVAEAGHQARQDHQDDGGNTPAGLFVTVILNAVLAIVWLFFVGYRLYRLDWR